MNPGMILRLEENSIHGFKNAMEDFLPHYINTDMNLPTSYNYTFGLFFDLLYWDMKWTNITYNPIDLDIKDV